ncbi:MAG: RluA family pseudouridine synthase, partial [Gemmataceae bacterium]|nr:RluA family pseudouridine synthase [Gemmataceae bacterium]
GGGSLLELRPKTGRSHQLRVQAAVRGHPIWGDILYGSNVPFGPEGVLPQDRVIALHARSLGFIHPTRRERLEIVADPPSHWPTLDG